MRDRISRRSAIQALSAAAGSLGLAPVWAAAEGEKSVELQVHPDRILGRTPSNFLGFGYEISAVAQKGLLSAQNKHLVALYRLLGAEGVVRIGGNTSDFSSYSPDAPAVSAPKGTVTNREVIDDLGAFLQATNWKLIWGLNLGAGTVENAAEQAVAVAAAAKDNLLCFEIGNEPDLFKIEHRTGPYSYADYHREFEPFAAALRQRIPNVPIAGPDVADATNWVPSFAEDEGKKNLKLLTHHYYRSGQKQPAATFENLLHTDPRFIQMIGKMRSYSQQFGLPYRLVELNSFSGGGKPGLSDTFTSALWALDLLFTLASAEGAGINLETGVNQLGFVSSYSPIFDEAGGKLTARPSYYAMLAFAQAGSGQRVETTLAASDLNMTAYGVRGNSGKLWVTLINKDQKSSARVRVTGLGVNGRASVLRLVAPTFDSKIDVTLGGSEVSNEGHWAPRSRESVAIRGGEVEVTVAPCSAVLLESS